MARYDKFCVHHRPNDFLAEVARDVIAGRLAAVWNFLSLAAKHPSRAEYVHDLRVWSRRSVATIDLFKSLLPHRRARRMRRRLIRVRRAAGLARDLDVLDRRFAGRGPMNQGRRLLRRRIATRLRKARKPLAKWHKK